MQAVSTLDSAAQPQPFSGHAQKDLQFLGTFGIPNMIDVLEHHGMLEVGLLSLQVVHVSIGEKGAHFQGCTAVSESQLLATTQSKCGLARHTSKTYAGLAEACWY